MKLKFKRDDKGRPIKPPMIGRAWSNDDLLELVDALIGVTSEEDPGHALELLDYGYRITPLSAEQYDYIKALILHHGNKARKK